jgi:hypothetical protein
MYVTIVTGRVAQENWVPLAQLFERHIAKNPPPRLLKSCLVQSEKELSCWRIVFLWNDKAAFEEYHATRKADDYIELMCDAGTVPECHGYHSRGWYEKV